MFTRFVGKIAITINVDADVYSDFKSAVTRRYHKSRGHMFEEWNQALRHRTAELEKQTRRIRASKKETGTTIFGPDDEREDDDLESDD